METKSLSPSLTVNPSENFHDIYIYIYIYIYIVVSAENFIGIPRSFIKWKQMGYILKHSPLTDQTLLT